MSCLRFGANVNNPSLGVHGDDFDSLEYMNLGLGWLANMVPLCLADKEIAIPDCLKSFALIRCEI